MNYLFYNAIAFNEDISSWSVSWVRTMEGTFKGAKKFNQDLTPWTMANITSTKDMFVGASDFNQILCWHLVHVAEDIQKSMFTDCCTCDGCKAELLGSETCTPTPAPTTKPYCDPGFYVKPGEGCTACPVGRYQSDYDYILDCNVCPAGRIAPSAASALCDGCPSGKFLADAGQIESLHDEKSDCVSCDPGFYSDREAATSCFRCALGTANNASGSHSCSLCLPGKFSASTGSTHCASCSFGTFNKFSGAVSW